LGVRVSRQHLRRLRSHARCQTASV
jgi:hypothetical protein